MLLLLGGLLAQLWNRFRTRVRRFTWKAWHQPIAIAANHPQLGTVTVQFNGTPVNHVHVTTVELVNDSSEDQEDVVVTLSFQGIGHIINSAGFIQGCLGSIPFDPAYAALYQGATPQQVQILNTYVVHKIPVFNRGQKATFNLSVVRDDASTPVVQVSCNHPGVKLDYLPSEVELDGVPYNLAVGMGFIVTGIFIFLMLRYSAHPHPYLYPVSAWLLGAFGGRVGAAVVRGWKTFVRLLG